MPDIRHDVKPEVIDAWLKKLLTRAGIQVVSFRDGANGLLNVPNKYVRVIDAMHVALHNLAAGESLPEFTEDEPKKPKTPKKKKKKT